jgi:hypothetical protein
MRYIEIEQIGNPIRRRRDQREMLTGFKLNNQLGVLAARDAGDARRDRRSLLGEVTRDPKAQKAVAGARAPDESAHSRTQVAGFLTPNSEI